jgi:hypothetical protein
MPRPNNPERVVVIQRKMRRHRLLQYVVLYFIGFGELALPLKVIRKVRNVASTKQ